MRWYQWLGLMLVGAVAVWLLILGIHNAGAEEKEAGPKWKIVVVMEGPPGKQTLTYGTQETGPVWFKDHEECEAARKGGDKKFATGMKTLQAQAKQAHLPIEITSVCLPDSSV